jgi:hypothetical protein
MSKEIYIAPAKRKFMIPDSAWNILAVYKVFWPPETTVKLGKKIVKLEDLYPWPPAEQSMLVDVPANEKKRETNMG